MRAGKDVTGNFDGAEQISEISRERFAPDAIDNVPQDVAKFMFIKRSAQNMGAFLMEFDMMRQNAKARENGK